MSQDDLRGSNLTDSGERPYALSKTYLLMGLTRELARRLEGSGVDVIAGVRGNRLCTRGTAFCTVLLSCLNPDSSLVACLCKQLVAALSRLSKLF
jgi:hypothetical protein